MNRDGFLYSAALGATFEGYLADRVILLLKVRQRCAFGSPTGVFHTELGFGLRFIIN
ncbi:conjugal transfer protein TraO [Alistipes indistinctus]|uniref:conjugal transfer protein TraO n=1 Tax=Alistipes indistinctus TaxID=626932 RepID=UPI003F0B52A6